MTSTGHHDEPDLADRIHHRRREAFEQLYRRHVDAVTRYVAARMRDRDRDAIADLVQDTFCDALADPSLGDADVLGSLLRLAARACNRHVWILRTTEIIYEMGSTSTG